MLGLSVSRLGGLGEAERRTPRRSDTIYGGVGSQALGTNRTVYHVGNGLPCQHTAHPTPTRRGLVISPSSLPACLVGCLARKSLLERGKTTREILLIY